VPTEDDGLPLEEGDTVEILDSRNPDRWMCRMLDQPDRQGWVPPSYLVAKTDEKLDTRTTQEVFREDIIKISNKQQEAVMKRRYHTYPQLENFQYGCFDLGTLYLTSEKLILKKVCSDAERLCSKFHENGICTF